MVDSCQSLAVTIGNLGERLSKMSLRFDLPLLVEGEKREWKLLGQEQDKSLLVSWLIAVSPDETSTNQSRCIGRYQQERNCLEVLHTFNDETNVVQASVNASQTLLVFVTKEKIYEGEAINESSWNSKSKPAWQEVYKAFIIKINSKVQQTPHLVCSERSRQILVQFLYKRKEYAGNEKFLLFIHQEAISLNQVNLEENCGNYSVTDDAISSESIVRSFTWAQWDSVSQCLYYIHYRKPQLVVEGEEPVEGQDGELAPTLSCLQFHDELPHETVLNIPLNLPQLPGSTTSPCSVYEDDPIPLRVHDCSLDLQVVSDPSGIVCICHHYLYQPVKPPEVGTSSQVANTVHFAYSVTLLHHGCVIHCVVPGIQWSEARTMKPTFALHGGTNSLSFYNIVIRV